MKKRILSVFLAVVMVLQVATPAMAMEIKGGENVGNPGHVDIGFEEKTYINDTGNKIQQYKTEDQKNHTIIWTKGVDGPEMSGTINNGTKNRYGDFIKVNDNKGNQWESLLYTLAYQENRGYYDMNKLHPGADSRCYLSAATNMIYWWMEQNKNNINEYIKGIEEGKFVQPDGLTPIKGEDTTGLWKNIMTPPVMTTKDGAYAQFLEDSYLTKNHFNDYNALSLAQKKGYYMDKVYDFFFNGYKAIKGDDPNRIEDFEKDSKGGFFHSVTGTKSLTKRYGGSKYDFYNQNMEKWLREGKGITIALTVGSTLHAITVWGAEYDENHNLCKIYVSDSDDVQSVYDGGKSQGIYTYDIVNVNNIAHIGTYVDKENKPGQIISNAITLDLMEEEWQNILGDTSLEPALPIINNQPKGRNYGLGATAEPMTIDASIDEKDINKNAYLTYQWYKTDSKDAEGTAIEKATKNSYTPVISDQPSTEYYYCVVTNNKYGKTIDKKSDIAEIITENSQVENAEAPTFTSNIQPNNPKKISVGESVSLEVNANQPTDGGVVSYQWYQCLDSGKTNPQKLVNETNKTFNFNPKATGNYYYYCKITNTNNNVNGTRTNSVETGVQKFEVSESKKIPQTISISGAPSENPKYGDNFKLQATGGSGTGEITWSITSGSQYAEVDNQGNVTVSGVGTFTVKATKSEDETYKEASDTLTITSQKATPTVNSVTAEGDVYINSTKADIEKALKADATLGDKKVEGKVVLTDDEISLTPGNENTFNCIFKPLDSNNYNEVSTTVTVNCLDLQQQGPFSIEGVPTGKISYNDTFDLKGKGGSGDGKISWEITSGNQYAHINQSGHVTITGVGTVKVQATKAASGSFAPATTTVEITSHKATPSITNVQASGKFTVESTKLDIENRITYDQNVNGQLKLDGSLSLSEGSNTLNWTFTPVDTTNYEIVKGTITIQCEAVKEPEQPGGGAGGGGTVPGGGGGSAGGGGGAGGGGTPPVKPEEPETPVVPEPEVVKPEPPVVPESGKGANIGMDQTQQAEADKSLGEIVTDIISAVMPKPDEGNKPESGEGEKPVPPVMEQENRETVEKIAEAVKQAEKIQVKVVAEKIDKKTAPETTQQEVEKIQQHAEKNLKGAEILQAADIKIKVEAVNKEGDNRTLGNLTKIKTPISFTIQLPKDTAGDKFGVARVHKGQVELLDEKDVTYDPISKVVTFKTDRFSTYAVYKYEEKISNTDKPENPGDKPEQPEQSGKPGQVKNVKVKGDYGLIKVTFDKVKGADSYKVFVRQPGKDWGFINTKANSLVIKKLYKNPLLKNARYQVKVVAINEKGQGEFSQMKNVWSNRVGTKAAVMPAAKFISITSNRGTAKVTAKKITFKTAPKAVQYKVSYKVKGTEQWKSPGYKAQNVQSIKGLKRGKTYRFALRYRYKSALDGKTMVSSSVVYKNVRIK